MPGQVSTSAARGWLTQAQGLNPSRVLYAAGTLATQIHACRSNYTWFPDLTLNFPSDFGSRVFSLASFKLAVFCI